MNNDLVSIIVPIYNAAEYLQDLLDSVKKQIFDNYELILVNDGSTDNSEKICIDNTKTNHKIKYFKKENTGVSDTRNYGIEKSTGKYICFIDADDILDKNYLNDLVYSIDKYDLSCCEYRKFSIQIDNMATIPLVSKEYIGKEIYQILYDQYGGYLWNKLFVRDIIVNYNLKFNKEISMCEDMLFVFEYLKHANSVICINRQNYNYRIVDSSASKNLNNMKWFSLFKTLDKIISERKLYTEKLYNTIMYSYIFYLYEARYRLKCNKKNENYTIYKKNINNRIKSLKKYEYSLSFKQSIKLFIYRYFNTIAFKIKKGR